MIYIHDSLSLPDEAAETLEHMVDQTFATLTESARAAGTPGHEPAALRQDLKVAAATYLLAVGRASDKFLRRTLAPVPLVDTTKELL